MDIFDYLNIVYKIVLVILIIIWQYYVFKLKRIQHVRLLNSYYIGIMILGCGVVLNLLGAIKLVSTFNYIWLIKLLYFLGFSITILAIIKLLKIQIELAVKLRAELVTDFLTGAGNRKYLNEVWPAIIKVADVNNDPVTVMLLDLDNFKKLNDHYGHGYGDKVLTKVVDNLRSTLKASEHIIRYGGDEFVIILPGTDEYLAGKISTYIKYNLKQMSLTKNETIQISSGFAIYPHDGDGIDALLDIADKRMYQDKTNKTPSQAVGTLI